MACHGGSSITPRDFVTRDMKNIYTTKVTTFHMAELGSVVYNTAPHVVDFLRNQRINDYADSVHNYLRPFWNAPYAGSAVRGYEYYRQARPYLRQADRYLSSTFGDGYARSFSGWGRSSEKPTSSSFSGRYKFSKKNWKYQRQTTAIPRSFRRRSFRRYKKTKRSRR